MLDYTFGHDEIAQRVVERSDPNTITSDDTHVFGHDGHGSVRVIYDLAATAASIAQVFTFAAYGEMITLHNAIAQSIDVANRLSSLGYSGEHFDAEAQQQYLRARFYDPANGRFNRVDPFAGKTQDPQSLHKYAYVHGDPINGTDPTGMWNFFAEMGKAAHLGVNALYAAHHPGNVVSYSNWLPGFGGSLIPDIMNFSLGTIAEIKPLSPYGVSTGPTQLYGYLAAANRASIEHDGPPLPWRPDSWQPGVRLIMPTPLSPYDFGRWVIITLGNWGGVVYYKQFYVPNNGPLVLAASLLLVEVEASLESLANQARYLSAETIEWVLEEKTKVAALATIGALAYYAPAASPLVTAFTGSAVSMLSGVVSSVSMRTASIGA